AGVGVEVVDPLLEGEEVELLLAVLTEPQLDERVATRPVGGAFAKEAETPAYELRVDAQAQLDRGLLSEQRAHEHRGRARRGPRERVAGRDQARVAAGRVGAQEVGALDELDLGALARQVVRGRHAHDAAAEDEN